MQPQAQTPDLKALVERVEAATGPDRMLDRDLSESFYQDILKRDYRVLAADQAAWLHPDHGLVRCEPYTASLDASLGLCERVLPGRRVMLWQDISDDEWGAHFRAPDTDTQYAPTPALALLKAVLDVLIANQETV